MPRFSPDGRWIAFTGEYQGNPDVYVMPRRGRIAKRITFTSDLVPEAVGARGTQQHGGDLDTGLEERRVPVARMAWNTWINRLFTVPATGGMAQLMPLDRGGFLSYSPDGKQIAFNRIFRNFRTWKRYDGGLAQDIDVYDFDSRKLTHVTDWPGTETFPMWSGKTNLFPIRSRLTPSREHLGIRHGSREFRQITHYTDYDIDFPSLGAGDGAAGIVFQQGGKLHVLDIPSSRCMTSTSWCRMTARGPGRTG